MASATFARKPPRMGLLATGNFSFAWYHPTTTTMSARRDKSTTASRRRANRQRLVFIIIGILVILAFVLSLVGSP